MIIHNKEAKTIEMSMGLDSSIGVVLEGEDKGLLFSKTMKQGKLIITGSTKVSSLKQVRYFDGICIDEYEKKYFSK